MFVPKGDEHTLAQWEDKFFSVLQEKEELARRVVNLSNDLRNIKAKSTRFENTIRQKNRLDKEDSHTITSRPKKFDRDEKEFIEDLKLRNHNLQQDNKKLEEKLRTVIQVLKKYKQQVQTLKLRHDSGPHVRQRGGRGNGPKIGVSDSSSEQFESDVKNVMGQLQQRLVHTEEELRNLEKENQKLKRYHNESRSDVHANYNDTNHEVHVSHCYLLNVC
jgi:predicted  nucleic acid-binding Zn-ribbon protein